MTRYIQDVRLTRPDNDVFFIVNDFLQKNGFSRINQNGEGAYCAGNPAQTGCKFLKWSYASGHFHLEAWITGTEAEQPSGGLMGEGEGTLYRNQLEALIFELQRLPSGQNPNTANVPAVVSAPAPAPAPAKDYSNWAIVSFVLGILSVVFCFSLFFCLICGVTGILLARDGCHSDQASLAKAGKVCSIIGLSMSAAYLVFTIAIMLFPIFFGILLSM